MKLRSSLALIGCVVGASLIPGIAAADRPEKEVLNPVGDQIDCDGTVLTVSSGEIVGRTHVHELPSGRIRDIGVFLNRDVTATDEEETVYRVVGGTRLNFTSDPENGEEIGFFHDKFNIIGPGGLFGKVNFRVQIKRNGDEIVRDKGNCEFV
jgi:hypothetical protein